MLTKDTTYSNLEKAFASVPLPERPFSVLKLNDLDPQVAEKLIALVCSQESGLNSSNAWAGPLFDSDPATVGRTRELKKWIQGNLAENRTAFSAQLADGTRITLGVTGKNQPLGIMLSRFLDISGRETGRDFDEVFNQTVTPYQNLKFVWRETSAVAPHMTLGDPKLWQRGALITPVREELNIEKALNDALIEDAIAAGADIVVTEENRKGWIGMRHPHLMERLDATGYAAMTTGNFEVDYAWPMTAGKAVENWDRGLYVRILNNSLLNPDGTIPSALYKAIVFTMHQKGWKIGAENYDDGAEFLQKDVDKTLKRVGQQVEGIKALSIQLPTSAQRRAAA